MNGERSCVGCRKDGKQRQIVCSFCRRNPYQLSHELPDGYETLPEMSKVAIGGHINTDDCSMTDTLNFLKREIHENTGIPLSLINFDVLHSCIKIIQQGYLLQKLHKDMLRYDE
jgi:hypothetical protein